MARRQKRRGMHWSQEMSEGLVALRILILNQEWDAYWQKTRNPLRALSPTPMAR